MQIKSVTASPPLGSSTPDRGTSPAAIRSSAAGFSLNTSRSMPSSGSLQRKFAIDRRCVMDWFGCAKDQCRVGIRPIRWQRYPQRSKPHATCNANACMSRNMQTHGGAPWREQESKRCRLHASTISSRKAAGAKAPWPCGKNNTLQRATQLQLHYIAWRRLRPAVHNTHRREKT